MNYAFIKNNICENVAVFDSQKDAINFKQFADCDDITPAEDGFGIGDSYEEETWTKTEHQQTNIDVPTIEERLSIAEDTINFLLGL